MTSEALICEEGGAGIVLPLFGDWEQGWPRWLRVSLYLLGLGWLFQGVGVVCDAFMEAIEQITSRKERRLDRKTGRHVTVTVWNATVANLTLMALGSSAPEILLNVIEAGADGFFVGRLGPSTIIGSAAFNLLAITAICISSIPDGEVRKINDTSVYAVTATFSIFAYLWVCFILMVSSENVIEPWEGVVTFLQFPALIGISYSADKGYLNFFRTEKEEEQPQTEAPKAVLGPNISKEAVAELEAKMRLAHGHENISDRQLARLMQFYFAEPVTRAGYRRMSRQQGRNGTGSKERPSMALGTAGTAAARQSWAQAPSDRSTKSSRRVVPYIAEDQAKEKEAGTGETRDAAAARAEASSTGDLSKAKSPEPIAEEGASRSPQRPGVTEAGTGEAICPPAPMPSQPPLPGGATPALPEEVDEPAVRGRPEVAFELQRYAVIEGTRSLRLSVLRKGGSSDEPLVVAYKTREGTAKESRDFTHTEGRLEFMQSVSEGHIIVQLMHSHTVDGSQEFFVDLLHPETGLTLATTTIVSVGDDSPGMLHFQSEVTKVVDTGSDMEVKVFVERRDGSSGTVSCKFCTEDCSAIAGVDYEQAEGKIVLEARQTSATITLKILGKGRCERTDMLRVVLSDPSGGATFDPEGDGGEENCISYVIIEPPKEQNAHISRIREALISNWQKAHPNHTSWKSQFFDALKVNPDDDDDDNDEDEEEDGPRSSPSAFDKCMMWFNHILLLPWKLLFALVPPAGYCGGWACFWCSLFGIGLVTAVVKDMASLLGCVMDIPDQITAITLVALGTSLPDTFASKTAAINDPYADASVGNVTGSNSVNVFLGLGLPWMFGAVYWQVAGANSKWTSMYASQPWAAGWEDGALVVEAAGLGFSVAVFSCCAVTTIALLLVRRKIAGGELGGPVNLKYACSAFLLFLWVLFVSLTSWDMLTNHNK